MLEQRNDRDHHKGKRRLSCEFCRQKGYMCEAPKKGGGYFHHQAKKSVEKDFELKEVKKELKQKKKELKKTKAEVSRLKKQLEGAE